MAGGKYSGTENFREEIDWKSIILWHINRLNQISTTGAGDWVTGVRVFEAELSAMFDDVYTASKMEIEAYVREAEQELRLTKLYDRTGKVSNYYIQQEISRLYFNATLKKFENIMLLLKRNNLYLRVYQTVHLSKFNFIVERWVTRVSKLNKSENIILTGEPGSGKSWSALTIAKILADRLGVKYYVVFTADQFLELAKQNLPRGTIIIFDEAGAGISNREFWKEEQIKLMKVWQTMRYKNLIVILTVPSIKFIDKIAKLLANTIIECKRVNFKKCVVEADIWHNELGRVKAKKDTYAKFYRGPGGKPITSILIAKPDEGMINKYETDKENYLKELYSSELRAAKKKLINELSDEEITNEILKDIELLAHIKTKSGFSQTRIQTKFKIGWRRSPRVAELLRVAWENDSKLRLKVAKLQKEQKEKRVKKGKK